MALGYCAAFGTLMPPLFRGELGAIADDRGGPIVLSACSSAWPGSSSAAWRGGRRSGELTDEQKQAVIQDFSFVKGVVVATIAGILSACMSYGFAAGKPIAELAVRARGAPALAEHARPGRRPGRRVHHELPLVPLPQRPQPHRRAITSAAARIGAADRWPRTMPLCAAAGVIWYLQFFFYGMGTTLMGRFDFSSWTLHMASIMIFGTALGPAPRRVEGLEPRGRTPLNAAGLADPRRLDGGRRLRQLPRRVAPADGPPRRLDTRGP